jgi:hypothetical protein
VDFQALLLYELIGKMEGRIPDGVVVVPVIDHFRLITDFEDETFHRFEKKEIAIQKYNVLGAHALIDVIRLPDRRIRHPGMSHGNGKFIDPVFADLKGGGNVHAIDVSGQELPLLVPRTIGDDGDLARDGRVHGERLDRQQITVDIPPIQKRADFIRRSIVGSDRPGFQGGLEGVSGQATDIVGTLQDLLYSPRHPFFDKNCFVKLSNHSI